ncbi:hypothetical protein HOL34_02370 [bacterium]|nr:hypothetical protein [bacterium]MBT3903604.1 hypothetical protein [bacterium]MBT4577878.1 hypothetical protein [bacterium]MBT5345943.1 hypothetical protein [bacterium]MBT6130729.1 hypothetical protein [bacterium]
MYKRSIPQQAGFMLMEVLVACTVLAMLAIFLGSWMVKINTAYLQLDRTLHQPSQPLASGIGKRFVR